jgi:hypothetical protein
MNHEVDPWELGGDWYRLFDWASLDKTVYPQGGGKRPKYADPEVMLPLLHYIEEGLPMSDAARLAGVGPSTLYEWRETVPAVREALKGAEAKFKATMVAHIRRAAPTQWQAAMTMLERRFPEDFGRRDRIHHEHAGQVGLQVHPALMDERSILLAAELEERLSAAETRLLDAHREGDLLEEA